MNKTSLLVSSLVILLILGSVQAVAETESETETHSSSQTSYQTPGSPESSGLQFSIVPVPVPSSPNYAEGSGEGSIHLEGNALSIHVHLLGSASQAHLMLALAVNNSTQSVANMTSDGEGELEAEAQVTLGAGNYLLGMRIFDTSTFVTPTLVMTSSPSETQLQISPSSQSAYAHSETDGQPVNPVGGSESDDREVRSAIMSMVIPAVVDVSSSGSSAAVNDNRFSVSVGTLQNNGIIVSVSAMNVTGPRVLLVNLTAPTAQKLFSGSILITLDGAQIQQSSSVSQVLSPQSGDPARFVVFSSGTGLKLLISIPHFSYHTIQILPLLSEIGSALLDLPSLLLSVAAASAVIFLAYARRTRLVI